MRTKEGRIHLRVESDLEEKIKVYAKRHGTNMSRLVVEYFKKLLEEERLSQAPVDVAQI